LLKKERKKTSHWILVFKLSRKENGSVDEKMEKKLTTKPMRAIGLASNVEMSMAYGAKIIHWRSIHCFLLCLLRSSFFA